MKSLLVIFFAGLELAAHAVGANVSGRIPMQVSGTLVGPVVTWSGLMHITGGDVTVLEGTMLMIVEGTEIHVEKARKIIVRGSLRVEGTAVCPVIFGPEPGTPLEADPASAGLPPAPPKWGGVQFVNSMSADNWISYAQIHHAQTMEGGIGLVASKATIDHCTFSGTHWRVIYCNASAPRIQFCTFPDSFGPTENAVQLGIDNVAEHIKAEGAIPDGERFLIYRNTFGTNKGHNDVIDVDSGTRPAPIVEIRENFFHGAGDELCDLGGDVLLDGNIFQHVTKDPAMANGVYANAISTGDPGNPSATVVCTRNIFRDLDHAISCRVGTATIFEHNTVVGIHPDFIDVGGRANTGSAISLRAVSFGDARGDGCQLAGNIFWNLPRVIGAADSPVTTVSRIEAASNFVDPAASLAIGERKQNLFDLGRFNRTGDPLFVDIAAGDLHLSQNSPAKQRGVMNRDAGAYVPSGAWVDTQVHGMTSLASQTVTVGGPGIFAYRWRMRGEVEWSAPQPIGEALFSRINPSVRTATFEITNLAPGAHQLEVIGQDFSSQWQDGNAPTRSLEWIVCSPPKLFNDLAVDAETDSDGDGLNNLQEYAFGLSMDTQDAIAITATRNGAGQLEATFVIPSSGCDSEHVGATDIVYHVMTSTDLIRWNQMGSILAGVISTPLISAGSTVNERRIIKVTAPSPSGSIGRQFLVIVITRVI